ncbi:hypothetical protein [Psychromonas sp. KJ10-2]|uniref:hypothetical protein n=1 Tax=Psychromonas sp. KJ10-2 TaxID=3391822 RepID=UPI0039B38F5A
MPDLDENGCTTINGFNVCEDDFDASPIEGISPFCRRVDADFDCAFNEGEICTTNMDGEETCFQNETIDTNTCEALEQSETCSYVGTECVEGAMSDAGTCYVQTDTYDCGYDATSGTESVQEVLICDGEIQCVGESCYSPQRDEPNSSFAEANAYLQILQYAQNDFTCENIPEESYSEENTPDRYYPTVTCPTGFDYNSASNTCLQQVGECSFDQDNYYAVSSRSGAQIVSEGSTIFENSAITYCTPIDIGGYTYTCGETLQKVANDEFSEICKNTSATAIASSCVTDTHLLKDGICEVPPTSLCPSGYVLTEGDDPWSTDDDICS